MACLALAGPAVVSAQLVNGSFEDENGSTMFGWSSYSMPSFTEHDAPSGGGNWSASPATTNYQWNSGLQGTYQDLPWLMDGDVISLSAWLKSSSLGCNGGARLDLLHVISDVSFIALSVTDTAWTHVQYDGPVYFVDGQTPRLVLGAFYPCGPNYNPYAGSVDEVSLTVTGPSGIQTEVAKGYTLAYDAGSGIVSIATADPMVGGFRCADIHGRDMAIHADAADRQVRLNVGNLASGLYVFYCSTINGKVVARFFKP